MIELEYSYWLVPVCIVLAGIISFLLYSKKAPWNQLTNKVLALLRFVLAFGLFFLLLNPLLKQFVKTTEKPKIVISLDNSRSMNHIVDSLEMNNTRLALRTLEDRLLGRGYAVDKMAGDQSIDSFDSLRFDKEKTDLTGWIRNVESKYENQNVVGMYVVSDGNFNTGIAPSYASFDVPIFTIGVGDTTQVKDIELLDIQFNKIVYQGNKFPVQLDIMNHGYNSSNTAVSLYRSGKKVISKQCELKNGLSQVFFELDADYEGLQKYLVKVDPLPDEQITENNFRSMYFDVIDGKQKIVIVAPAPHPDLKTLRVIIEKNKNYEVELVTSNIEKLQNTKFDLAIVHTPNDRLNRTANFITKLKNAQVPIMYIMGASTVVRNFSKAEQSLSLNQNGSQRDNINGAFNNEFNLFSLPSFTNERLEQFIPLSVPYGDVRLNETAQVLLYQKVGSVVTNKPLVYVDESNGQKVAVWLADGMWQWRQQEFAINDNSQVIDAVIANLVKFMSTKTDKRKFKFYPKKNEYTTQERVVFDTEIYNEVYERVYDVEISVKLTDEAGDNKSYTFVPSSNYSVLEIANLKEGIYKYEAVATLGGKDEKVRGSLIVKELKLEEMVQKANFDVLDNMATNSQGHFFTLSEVPEMMNQIDQMNHTGVLHQEEQNLSIINVYWILLLIILLVSSEWFIRKYNGGY